MSWSRLGIKRETAFSIFTDTMVEMTWVEVEDEVKNNSIVLLPVGIIDFFEADLENDSLKIQAVLSKDN